MNNNNFKNMESGHIIAGLILVAVGGVLLLRTMGFFFPGWLFTWPIILILVGTYTGFKHNFRNNSPGAGMRRGHFSRAFLYQSKR